MKIGEWVHSYRKEHGLSMQTFGDMCGLSRAYISILERGINPTTGKSFVPTIQTLKKIADVTHTDFDKLLSFLDGSQKVLINCPSEETAPNGFIKLSPTEQQHIKKYRKLSPAGKKEVDHYLDFRLSAEAPRVEKDAEISSS